MINFLKDRVFGGVFGSVFGFFSYMVAIPQNLNILDKSVFGIKTLNFNLAIKHFVFFLFSFKAVAQQNEGQNLVEYKVIAAKVHCLG